MFCGVDIDHFDDFLAHFVVKMQMLIMITHEFASCFDINQGMSIIFSLFCQCQYQADNINININIDIDNNTIINMKTRLVVE